MKGLASLLILLTLLAAAPALAANSATATVKVSADKAVIVTIYPTAFSIKINTVEVPPGSSVEFKSAKGKLTVAANYPVKVVSEAKVPKELNGRFWLYVDGKRYKPGGWSDTLKIGVKAHEVWFSVVADWYLPAGEYYAYVTFTVVPA